MPVRRPRAALVLIGALLLVLAAGVRASPANGVTASWATVDQQALQACLDQARDTCDRTVPGLAPCMAAHVVCNAAAFAAQPQQVGPLPPGTSATGLMTEAAAIRLALADAPGVTPRPPVIARAMTLAAYARLTHGSVSEFGRINPSQIVWVVTVHAPMWTDGAPFAPPRLMAAYTIVFDAASWRGLEICIGCATLG